jgi:predicted enzyme related to lactoylglutathione lyase
MPRVIHFEVHADQPERAIKFYKDVFDWKIEKWPSMDYWLITTGEKDDPGIDGAITPRMDKNTTVNTIGVDSIDKYVAKVLASGGKVVMPKGPIPGVGYFAGCIDSEGNSFGLMQSDPNAK